MIQDFSQTIAPADPELFAAVWSRVMEGRESPIALGTAKIQSKPEKSLPLPAKNPVPTLKVTEKILCYGEAVEKGPLSEYISICINSTYEYEKLSTQLPQSLKSTGQALGKQKMEVLSQLETAYFLCFSENIQDIPRNTAQSGPKSLEQRLRALFRQAQIDQTAYQKSALSSQDSCLTTLFLQLELTAREEVSALQALTLEHFRLKQSHCRKNL